MWVCDNKGVVFIFLKLFIVMMSKFFKKSGLSDQSLGITITFLQTAKDPKI